MLAKTRRADRRADRRAQGLCIDCGKSPVAGRIRCAPHLKAHAARQARYEFQRGPTSHRAAPAFCVACIAIGFHRADCEVQP